MLLNLIILCGSTKVYSYKNLERRSYDEVCRKYNELYLKRRTKSIASNCFTKGENNCDVGIHSNDDIEDTVDVLNFYRYLTDTGSVRASTEKDVISQQMQASTMMRANNNLEHNGWNTSYACYTTDAFKGTSSSNIAWGPSCTANTIKLYIDDNGVDSLGHRRWCLYPPIDQVALGIDGPFSAFRTFDFNCTGTKEPDHIAFPPPGPIPIELLPMYWSFSREFKKNYHDKFNMPSDSQVSVKCNGKKVNIRQQILNSLPSNYPGIVKMIFPSKDSLPKPWQICEVVIKSEKENSEWRYVVKPINCSEVSGVIIDDNGGPVDEKTQRNVTITLVVVGLVIFGLMVFAVIYTSNKNSSDKNDVKEESE